ncbi:TolC family protein, partial [Francisella tularensis subsp. holarctica]|nr:TolC family protein [Francisella tularensis subsp. holarctica]
MKVVRIYLLIYLGIFAYCDISIANPVADYTSNINQSINNSPQYKFIGFQ